MYFNKFRGIIDYCTIFLMIVLTNSIYVNTDEENNLFIYFCISLGLSIILNVFSSAISKRLLNYILAFLVAYYSVLGLVFLLNIEQLSKNNIIYYFILAPVLVIYIIYIKYKNKLVMFVEKFVNVVIFLAILSLMFWFFGSIVEIIKPTGYVISNWANGAVVNSYYNIYFETQRIDILGNVIIRNSGIFAEAPMWSLVLSIGFIFQVYFLKLNKVKVGIIVLTILTTTSTTGVFIVGLTVIYLLYSKTKGSIKYVGLIAIPVIAYILSVVWGEKSGTGSASLRFDDYRVGFLAWKDNIFFGSGFKDGIITIQSYMDASIRDLGYSNSLFLVLAQGGMLLAGLYFYPMIKILLNHRCSMDLKIANILFFIIFSTTIFVDSFLFIFIIAIGYAYLFDNKEVT